MLGHASPVTTAKYAHVMQDDLRDAMEAQQQSAREAASRLADPSGLQGNPQGSPKLKLAE